LFRVLKLTQIAEHCSDARGPAKNHPVIGGDLPVGRKSVPYLALHCSRPLLRQ
jgi:hypothetical protein